MALEIVLKLNSPCRVLSVIENIALVGFLSGKFGSNVITRSSLLTILYSRMDS